MELLNLIMKSTENNIKLRATGEDVHKSKHQNAKHYVRGKARVSRGKVHRAGATDS